MTVYFLVMPDLIVQLNLNCLDPTALRKTKTVYNFGLSECNRVLDPTALRKTKTVYNFGLSECNRVNDYLRYI